MGRVGRKKKGKALKQALKDIEASYLALTVFDNIERINDSYKKSSDSYFDFYNNSSLPSMKLIRDFIESCLSHYPKNEKKELISRLRSGDDITLNPLHLNSFYMKC